MSRHISVGPGTKLFERADELEALRALLAGSADGASGIGVVRGPPGAGKTSLLMAARADAQDRGLRVLSARGSPHERDYPFAVVRQLLGPVVLAAGVDDRDALFSGAARHAQRLFDSSVDDPGSNAGGASAYVTLHGLFWLLAGVAQPKPVLVIVDDAHWCDSPSGGFLSFLARRLEGLAVTLLLAERADEVATPPWLSELRDDPRTRVTVPRLLSPQAIAAIAADRLGGELDDALGQACWQATGGNPFFVSAALDELKRDQPTGDARLVRLRSLGPTTVLRAVLVRLARLPAGAVELAHAVAVLGDGASLERAAALAELPLASARTTADSLVAIGVLAAEARELSFAHPIVRNALYRDLTPSAQATLHAHGCAGARRGRRRAGPGCGSSPAQPYGSTGRASHA